MSTPDSDEKAFAAALFSRDDDDADHSAEQPAARRVRLTEEDTSSNPVLDSDGARALARRLFTPTTNEGQSA